MDQIITKELLEENGVELEGKDVVALVNHLNEALEERVSTEITTALNDEQLEELVELQEKATDEEVGKWIENNVPELTEITQDEIDILIGELIEENATVDEAK